MWDGLFCDDVRQEVGNKATLVGIYSEHLNAQLPASANSPTTQILVSHLGARGTATWAVGKGPDEAIFDVMSSEGREIASVKVERNDEEAVAYGRDQRVGYIAFGPLRLGHNQELTLQLRTPDLKKPLILAKLKIILNFSAD